MRKFVVAGMFAAATIATAAAAHDVGAQFDNRGQCQAALSHVRNDQRRDPSLRGSGYEDLSTSDFQAESLRTTRCELVDGRYQVVFYVDGF